MVNSQLESVDNARLFDNVVRICSCCCWRDCAWSNWFSLTLISCSNSSTDFSIFRIVSNSSTFSNFAMLSSSLKEQPIFRFIHLSQLLECQVRLQRFLCSRHCSPERQFQSGRTLIAVKDHWSFLQQKILTWNYPRHWKSRYRVDRTPWSIWHLYLTSIPNLSSLGL